MKKTLLNQMAEYTSSEYWNDSCAINELKYALSNGATGATTNPVIVHTVLMQEMEQWRKNIARMIQRHANWTEEDLAWDVIHAMAGEAAEMLMPMYEDSQGNYGRICLQTDPRFYRNSQAIINQAKRFHQLAPNIQVKIPATAAGIQALETVTYLGIHAAATVCFTVSQAVAAGEAMERGLRRREAEGLSCDKVFPACAVMVGRLDDWLKVRVKHTQTKVNSEYLDYPGVAVVKKLQDIFASRKLRTRLLVAAYRNPMHWTQLIGGKVMHTIPYAWQLKFNEMDFSVRSTIAEPVDPEVISGLMELCPDFSRAYEIDGIAPEEFDSFGATRRTLRQFIDGFSQVASLIRDVMIPDPDIFGS